VTNQETFHGKQRRWHAYVSIAASGEDSAARTYSRSAYPKSSSKLEYTSNDINYWADWWSGSHPAETDRVIHKVMHDADYATVEATLQEVQDWFSEMSAAHPDFDGGMLVFSYSGHGRPGDGALCLNQSTHFDADDFIKACLAIQEATSSERRLKLALFLDSCYSGAFLLNVLEKTLHEHEDLFYPDYFFAASMPDEQAWEVPSVEQGVATYSRILQGRIEDPEEEWIWPHHPVYMDRHPNELIVGALGCSFSTGGAQNPVIFDEHDLSFLGRRVEVWTDYDYDNGLRPRHEWEADLVARRDSFRDSIADLTPDGDFDGTFLDPIAVDFHNRSYAKSNPSAKVGFDAQTFICFRQCGKSVSAVLEKIRSSGLDVTRIDEIEKVGQQVVVEVSREDPDKGVVSQRVAELRRLLLPLTSSDSVPNWLSDAMYGKDEPCDPALGCEACSRPPIKAGDTPRG
jgi:hypothetical protein